MGDKRQNTIAKHMTRNKIVSINGVTVVVESKSSTGY
jgi:hypothetical protein